jgi:hypothetical protein
MYILFGITCSDYPVGDAKLYGCFIVERVVHMCGDRSDNASSLS